MFHHHNRIVTLGPWTQVSHHVNTWSSLTQVSSMLFDLSVCLSVWMSVCLSVYESFCCLSVSVRPGGGMSLSSPSIPNTKYNATAHMDTSEKQKTLACVVMYVP